MSCEILKKNLSELVVKIGGWIDFEDRAVEAITKIQKKFPTSPGARFQKK